MSISIPTIDGENLFTKKNTFKFTQIGERLEIIRTDVPDPFPNSTAAYIIQHGDKTDRGYNEIIAGTFTSFYNRNDGWVNGPGEQSMTIWAGNYTYVTKIGNGSAHGYTVDGQLQFCGVYNEIGGFQVSLKNTGSPLGYISLFEGLASDSANEGVTSFDTKMVGAGLRIAKYNPSNRFSTIILTSSEALPVDAAMMANPQGLQLYKHYIDMRNANVTTGQAIVWKNNTSAAWQKADGSLAPVLWVNTADNVVVSVPTIGGKFFITGPGFAERFMVDFGADVADACWLWAGGKMRRVGIGAADSAGPGFRVLVVSND